MHAVEPLKVGQHFPFLGVENNQLIGIHMRDVQTAVRGVQALIVKPGRRPRQRHVRDNFQDFTLTRGRRRVVGGEENKKSGDSHQRTAEQKAASPHAVHLRKKWWHYLSSLKEPVPPLSDEPAERRGESQG
jgi:hypothetical protein